MHHQLTIVLVVIAKAPDRDLHRASNREQTRPPMCAMHVSHTACPRMVFKPVIWVTRKMAWFHSDSGCENVCSVLLRFSGVWSDNTHAPIVYDIMPECPRVLRQDKYEPHCTSICTPAELAEKPSKDKLRFALWHMLPLDRPHSITALSPESAITEPRRFILNLRVAETIRLCWRLTSGPEQEVCESMVIATATNTFQS